MSYLDIYNKRNEAYGASIRESTINTLKLSIANSFFDSPSYYSVLQYTSTTPEATTPVDVWIVDDSNVKDQKVLLAYPGNLVEKGNMYIWKNKHWITISADPELGEIYSRGRMIQCISSIKWLDENSNIQETWFSYQSDRITENGVMDANELDMPNEKRYLVIQNNIHTQKIVKDQKFIFDNRAWKVTGLDGLNEGIIILVVKEERINPAVDDVDVRICNYHPVSSIPTTPTSPRTNFL